MQGAHQLFVDHDVTRVDDGHHAVVAILGYRLQQHLAVLQALPQPLLRRGASGLLPLGRVDAMQPHADASAFQQHVDGVIPHLVQYVKSRDDYDAFVIACYSDPGLHSLREATRKPVLGIAECGILTALTLGQRIGVIAILEQSIPRHLRSMGALGLMDRLAAMKE